MPSADSPRPSEGAALLEGMSPRRREIVASIATAFAARGYHGVGMRELARELGLNQGTLYHHFPSKDHALLAICRIGQGETHGNVRAVLRVEALFADRVRGLFDAHLASLDRLGDYVDVFTAQWEAVPPPLAAPLREGWAATRRLFHRLFEDALAAGEIAPGTDPHDAMRLLLGVYRTANVLHRTGRKEEMRPFVTLATDVLVRGFART
ncbi:transcriptional regulator, TetR family [Sphingobium faniae]|nr:transcriptional regulator, TetR family [Sphingobium faniae]